VIGLDTNVLLRALVDETDDAHGQAARNLVAAYVDATEPIHVNIVVLIESVWMLRRFGRLSREQVALFVESLLQIPSLSLAERPAVASALDLYRQGKGDFADALVAVLNRNAGCDTTYTFDRAAARVDGYRQIGIADA
jgi:predicted nucleic-acid-binding protein